MDSKKVKEKKMIIFHKLNEQLLRKIDWQTYYLVEKDDENFELTRQEIISTIEALQDLIQPPEDLTVYAQNLFGEQV
jgi:hypothetical protein